jgi:hypothetical protein
MKLVNRKTYLRSVVFGHRHEPGRECDPPGCARAQLVVRRYCEGRESNATLDSRANGLEPYAYLRNLFAALPKARTVEDFEQLLPFKRHGDAP